MLTTDCSVKFNLNIVLKMIVFCKNTNCPSSEKLLAFQRRREISESEIIENICGNVNFVRLK